MKKKTTWEEKRITLGNSIIIAAATLLVGLLIGLNWPNWSPYLGGDANDSLNFSSLNTVYQKLASTYDGEILKSDLIEGAKKGMVAALGDQYTVYMDAEESKDFNNSLHGNVGSGIGIEMGLRDGYVRVLRTLPDNPARAAGILAGDIIYKVNGEEVYSLTSDVISQKIRGEAGTEVTITVIRSGEEKSFTMVRETINNVSAYVEYDGTTAIVTLTRFDTDTGRLVQNFAQEFASRGITKVILDLRDNGGGYVSAAKDLLSLWISDEVILVQKSTHFGDSTTKAATGNDILKSTKTIVLINGSTASASEIVAGALQDYQKATLVGEKTYGKGVVQNLYNLNSGTSLKVTTASWYTPLGRSINKTGIEPDIEIKRSYDDINLMRDPQLDKAKSL